jgi:hypothetical protein
MNVLFEIINFTNALLIIIYLIQIKDKTFFLKIILFLSFIALFLTGLPIIGMIRSF